MGHPVEKDILKLLRSGSQLPEYILENRFVLFLSLALASVKQHQATVVECLKATICKNITLTVSFLMRQRKDKDKRFRVQ